MDINPEDYEYGYKTERMDIISIGLPDNSFDVTIYNHVLEHVPDDMTAMKEMFRILKRDGWAIVNVPVNTAIEETIEDPFVIDHQERKKLFGQPDHVRAYGGDYVTRLRNAGFNVEVINYVLKFSYNEQFGMV